MSPEQARGEAGRLTPRTDVWSLGCLLHEMLLGAPPFVGDTAAAVVGRVLVQEPAPIRRRRRDVPAGVERVIRVSLSKRPGDRYPDGAALAADLDRVLAGERPRARVPGARRRSAASAAAALAAVVTVAAIAWPAASGGSAPPRSLGPSEAERLASTAFGLRLKDPARGAELLGRALALDPERHAWRVEQGLTLWFAGDAAAAMDAWETVPPRAPEFRQARLYQGLEAFFRLAGKEAEPRLSPLTDGNDAAAALSRAVVAARRKAWAEARSALAGQQSWCASLLRAYVEAADPSGDPTKAEMEYTEALGEGIPFDWVYNNRGCAREDLGNLEGALADFDEALKRRPSEVKYRVNRGRIRVLRGDHRGGLQDLEDVPADSPDFLSALSHRARARSELGDIRGAFADLDRLLRTEPEDVTSRALRADLRRTAGDPRGALEDLDAVLRVRPDYYLALGSRAVVRQALGDTRGCLEDCEAALKLQPDCAEALAARGVIRAQKRDFAGARDDLDKALGFWPDRLELRMNRGVVRQELGDLPGALADLDAVLAAQPAHALALSNRAVVKRGLGDAGGALADLTALLEREPGHPVRLVNRASVRTDLGDFEGALADLREAEKRMPGHPILRANRSLVLARMGKCDEALAEAKAALAFDSKGPYYAYAARGLALLRQGKPREARAAFESFEALARPADPLRPAVAEWKAEASGAGAK